MRIPLNAIAFDDQEIEAAIGVLRSGQVTMGRQCGEFEELFARHLGISDALFVNSGSSANLLAFSLLANPLIDPIAAALGRRRLRPGDEVIVPAVTWSTSVWPIVQAGAIPVFVDSDPMTLQMSLEGVQAALSAKTVAVCAVHILGNSVEIAALRKLCDERGIWLVEDACESLGTRHERRHVGTFGDIGTFSFFFSHHITTIEGGMMVTPHQEIADLGRSMRAHGWTRNMRRRAEHEARHPDIDPRYLFISTGYNLRPTEINAAFGKRQLEKLPAFNQRRQEIAASWIKAFAPLTRAGDLFPMRPTPHTESFYFGFPVVCRERSQRDRLQAHLEREGVETRPIVCGNLTRQPALRHIEHRVAGPLPGADRIMDTGLYWGSHPMMVAADVDYVADVVSAFWQKELPRASVA